METISYRATSAFRNHQVFACCQKRCIWESDLVVGGLGCFAALAPTLSLLAYFQIERMDHKWKPEVGTKVESEMAGMSGRTTYYVFKLSSAQNLQRRIAISSQLL
jgi:hypothetical protein